MLKDTLLYLAQNQRMHNFVIHNRVTRGASRRFVAGEALDEAVQVAHTLNKQGLQVALDLLGENVTDDKEARAAAQDYIKAINLIERVHVDANISIKLTALGLDISRELCEENLATVLERASEQKTFVCVDMEGSNVTQATIDVFKRLRGEFGLNDVGIVLQSYLYRTMDDARDLLKIPARIRICKGAYDEPPEVAYPDKKDVDDNYIRVMQLLLSSGVYHGIATHDPKMIDATIDFAQREGIGKERFEFQMLYGIRRDLQEQLARDDYNMRVYVPYGKQWYPYFMRRLAERPANIWFMLKNLWK